jgi:hypothetical protein
VTRDVAQAGPNPRVAATDIPIAPQASLVLDGTIRYYGSTVASVGAVELLVIPGGTDWQNPVGVQVALADLGLATYDGQVPAGGRVALPVAGSTPADLRESE